jgi:hypothetical protein
MKACKFVNLFVSECGKEAVTSTPPENDFFGAHAVLYYGFHRHIDSGSRIPPKNLRGGGYQNIFREKPKTYLFREKHFFPNHGRLTVAVPQPRKDKKGVGCTTRIMLIVIHKFTGCEDYLPGRVGKTEESPSALTVAEAAPIPPSPVTSNAALPESSNTVPLSSDATDPSGEKDLPPVGDNITKTESSATTAVKSAGETDCKSVSPSDTAVIIAPSDTAAVLEVVPSPRPDDAKTPGPEAAVPSPKPEAKTTEDGTSSWDRKQEEEKEEGMEITDDVRDEFCVDSTEGGARPSRKEARE